MTLKSNESEAIPAAPAAPPPPRPPGSPPPVEPTTTIHLSASCCSGRAVRYRTLDASLIAHIESQVSHSIGMKDTTYDFGQKVVKMALEQMIVEVSEPVSRNRFAGKPENPGDPAPKPVPFRKVTPDELHTDWSKLFNAKDTAVLCRVHNIEHTVSKDELDEIFEGKVMTVP